MTKQLVIQTIIAHQQVIIKQRNYASRNSQTDQSTQTNDQTSNTKKHRLQLTMNHNGTSTQDHSGGHPSIFEQIRHQK